MEGELQMSRPLCVHHFVSEYGAQKLRECGESRATRLRDPPYKATCRELLAAGEDKARGHKESPLPTTPRPRFLTL